MSLVAAVVCFASCDPVAEDERYIEMEAVEAQRVVLLEEFTGQNCSNCPRAHQTIESLHEQYGETVISVSIHAGSFAYPEGMLGDMFQALKTTDGDHYADMWGIAAYPSGVINRRGGSSSHTEWASAIRAELERPTSLEMVLSAELQDGKICSEVTLKPSANIEGHLQLWVVEDSIISIQLDGSKTIIDYVHNHVYRGNVNGLDGTSVSLEDNVFKTEKYSSDVRSFWNPEHLSVVAFVYDDNGVVQASLTPVKINK